MIRHPAYLLCLRAHLDFDQRREGKRKFPRKGREARRHGDTETRPATPKVPASFPVSASFSVFPVFRDRFSNPERIGASL